LSWQIPTTRANGQALTVGELSGYEIYYTNDSGSVNTVYPVSGGSTTNVDIGNLSAGTYTFAMSAIDTSGAKSTLSAVVTVIVGP